MNEAELARRVVSLCDEAGVRHFHAHDARRSEPGWVDYVLWGPGGIIFRELKSADGRQSRAQIAVARSLREAGCNVAVWRPIDLEMGTIAHEIALLADERQRRSACAPSRRAPECSCTGWWRPPGTGGTPGVGSA